MLNRGILVVLCLLVALQDASARKRPRYVFVLPNGYVGWLQLIFNDPNAAALPMRDEGYVIDVPESGIARTSDIRVHDFKRKDEFYYRPSNAAGTEALQAVPAEDVLPGDSHGGFGVMDTGGRGRGYSWFIFIGPPSVRSKVPLADWEKEVEAWRKLHGNTRVSIPDPYPSPGRMQAAESPKSE